MSNTVLHTEGLSRHYMLGNETIHALREVSLNVKQGEFVAIMGPSGSGKSTLLHLLGLVDAPDAGEVFLDGAATSHLRDDELTKLRREKLGFIFQSFELIPTLSAKENILLPAEIAGHKQQALARLNDLAQQLGIADRLSHRPNELSGGQRQRVAIARALINEPVVILADEPTGNLDTNTGKDVLTLLQKGVSNAGWTVVMVTHDSNAATFADRIIRLEDGQLITDAPP